MTFRPPRLNPATLWSWLRNGWTTLDDGPWLINGLLPAKGLGQDASANNRTSLPEPSVANDRTRPQQLFKLLSDSVRQIAVEEQSISIALSGGIDSAAVAAAAKEALGPDRCIAVTFDYEGSPESARACETAKYLGIEWRRVRLDPASLEQDFDLVQSGLVEPCASPVAFADLALYRAAAGQSRSVLLSGHGADSLFAGGRAYVSLRIADLVRSLSLAHSIKMASCAGYATAKTAIGRLLPGLRRPETFPGVELKWFEEAGIFTSETKAAPRNMESQRRHELEKSTMPAVLRIEDAIARVASVHSRAPFLTPEMIAFAFTLDESELVSPDGMSKAILRESLKGKVPESVRMEKERVGFPVPAARWLFESRDWAAPLLERAFSLPFARGEFLRREWMQFVSEGAQSEPRAMMLWKWMMLWGWLQARGVDFD